MKFLTCFFVILTFASSALAERLIVVMKKQDTLFAQEPSFAMDIRGQVQTRLPRLNTYIVDTQSAADFEILKQNPDVQLVEKEVFDKAPGTPKNFDFSIPVINLHTSQPGAPWGVAAVRAPQAWGISGQGVGARVMLLDSGIDMTHPALQANFEKGRDFTGKSDGSNFFDLRGHGTHVAGIIAGAMSPTGFSGVAPTAKILMARVCADVCSTAARVEALDWAIAEKVDAINISIAGISATQAEKDAIAKVDKAGIPVIAASGNWGSDRVFFPAALPTVIAVGAVDESLKRATFSQYGPQLAVMAPGVNVVSSVPQGTSHERSVVISAQGEKYKLLASGFGGTKEISAPMTRKLVDCGNGEAKDYVGKDVRGKFALVTRGGPKFIEKLNLAIKAEADGVIFINNEPGLLEGRFTDEGVTLPLAVYMIEQAAGPQILEYLKAQVEVQATLQDLTSDYSYMDGTSMATPYVTGVVALVKATNKKLTAAQVKSLLKSTAKPLGPNPNNEYGSGLVDAEAAVRAALKMKN